MQTDRDVVRMKKMDRIFKNKSSRGQRQDKGEQ